MSTAAEASAAVTRPDLEGWKPGVVFVAAYVVLAIVTLRSSTVIPGLDFSRMVWLPSGVALAFIVQAGLRGWPWIFAGEAVVTLLTGDSLIGGLGTGAGAATEAIMAAWLLRGIGFSPSLSRWVDVVALIALGGGASSLLGSLVSVGSLVAAGRFEVGLLPEVTFRWWLSHASGILLLTPLVLTRSPRLARDIGARPVEAGILTLALVGVASALFSIGGAEDPAWLLLYAPFPLLLWAAFRFRVLGAAWANFLLFLPAIIGTALGRGPLFAEDLSQTVLQLAVFISVLVLTSIVVAGIVEDREEEAAARLAAEEERRVMADRMHQAQKLESLGVLAGGIAHDFNNLLATIMGNADLADRKLDFTHPAGDHIAEVLRGSRRAADLCKQILAYAGKGQVSSGVVDLNEVVLEMGELLSVSFPKDAQVEIRAGPTVPPVWGDVTQIRQVVLNLMVNAADALPGGRGALRVTTGAMNSSDVDPELIVSEAPPPAGTELVHFTVEDDGPGMEPSVRERIFEPFFTTKQVGRGLGLAVVLGIVRAHGGWLELRTAPGEGSRFRVLLPETRRREEVPAERSPLPVEGSLNGVCLLADDEPAVRKVCRRLLEELGLEVMEATDGLDALEQYRLHGNEIDLVLLDITMPRLDGYQALRRIRTLDPDARIVLSTGNLQDADEVELEWGVPMLAKPYGSQELRAVLARVLRGAGPARAKTREEVRG